MGNKLMQDAEDAKESKSQKTILSMRKFIQSKKKNRFFASDRRNSHTDSFILKYNRSNTNVITDISQLDQRRLLFVSIFWLFRNWKKYPSIQLYSAIIMAPLKEKWIYNLSKYANEMEQTQYFNISNFTDDVRAFNEFIELLKWKNDQGLIFWMLNDYSKYFNKCTNKVIDPFWIFFNFRLTKMYDPVTQKKYEPIKFDEMWWTEVYNDKNKSKFDVKSSDIVHELYFVTRSMKYKSIQEIIYQSNPKSLIPIASGEEMRAKKHMIKVRSLNLLKFDDETYDQCNVGDQGTWVIADDYC